MSCKLCNNLVISTAVTYSSTSNTLTITIPAGSYNNGQKYCIVVAQTIPTDTTISTPVYIQIGTGNVLYPLNRNTGAQVVASALRTRHRYATRVATTASGGSFNLINPICCQPNYNLNSISGS